MPFPKTKDELEAAGYRYVNSGQCTAQSCLAPVEWWRTPKNAKMPLDVGTLEPHWATCKAVAKFRKRTT